MALAGNKNDMYEHEEVEENEGKDLAQQLKAIFQKTSAKESTGVEDLFTRIGKKFLNPNSDGGSGAGKVDSTAKGQKLKSHSSKNGADKKGCC